MRKIVCTGSIIELLFKFKEKPEVLIPGSLLTFRSGSIHGIGMVTEIIPIDKDTDAEPDMTRKRLAHNRSKGTKSEKGKTYRKIKMNL